MTFSGQLLYRFGGGSFPKVLLVHGLELVGENCVLLFAFYAQYGEVHIFCGAKQERLITQY